MKTRRLGNSDMDFSVIGFGAWAVGGGWLFGWGPQDDEESIAAIQRAIDLGVNWIDTAHVYGFGRSEEVVGRALRGRRDGVFVATKCGLLRSDDGFSARPCLDGPSVRRELEGSLRRLGVDCIDLYQVHWPNPEDKIEEAWETLARAREEGLVRWCGVSNFNVAQMERIAAIAPVTSLQPPYSMLRRGIEDEILAYCRDRSIGIVGYSPMVNGLLTGKMTKERVAALPDDDFRRERSPLFQEPRLSAALDFVDATLRPIARRRGVEPGQVAVAWTLRDPAVTSSIVGARRPSQIEETVRAADVTLDAADLEAIEQGLARLSAAGG